MPRAQMSATPGGRSRRLSRRPRQPDRGAHARAARHVPRARSGKKAPAPHRGFAVAAVEDVALAVLGPLRAAGAALAAAANNALLAEGIDRRRPGAPPFETWAEVDRAIGFWADRACAQLEA